MNLVKNRSLKSNVTGRKKVIVLTMLSFAVVGVVALVRSFASIDDPYSNVIAEVYEKPSQVSGPTDDAELLGRLYKDGLLICKTETIKEAESLQRYKVVDLPKSTKSQLINEVNQKELEPSKELDAENYNTMLPSMSQVVVFKEGKSARQSTDATRKSSKKKDKAINFESLIKRNCKKQGPEFIPSSASYTARSLNKPASGSVQWPQSLDPLKDDATVVSENLAKLKVIHNSIEKSDEEFKNYILNNNLYSNEYLSINSVQKINSVQASQLYAIASSINKNTFNVQQNGKAYEIKVKFDLPSTLKSSNQQAGSTVSSIPNKAIMDTVKDKLTPKVEAAYLSPARSLRIKVLITDENRNSRPSLSKYYSAAQFNQLYWPGQANGRNLNISEVSYFETPVGLKASAYCGSGGLANCSTINVLNVMNRNSTLNIPNTYTALVIVGAQDTNACGRAYNPGNILVITDNSNICRNTVGETANTLAHEFSHNIGFNHEPGSTTLMGLCYSELFGCRLSDIHRFYLNFDGTYNYAYRTKAIPAFNCPLYYGLVYPQVQQGSTGDCVKILQWRLNNLNSGADFKLAVDGSFGPGTLNVVKYVQTYVGLPATGIVDGNTWSAINALST